MQRESLGSRLGFILISAGCAIGIGNVWKFPYLCGQSGGGLFVLIYLFFLIVLGLPTMTMEFAMGRASRKSPVRMYQELEPKGSKWHLHGILCMIGNYLLMMYYSTVAGWMLQYFFRTAAGSFENLDADQVAGAFTGGLGNPLIQVGCMAIVVVLGFFVNSQGLQNGLEKVTKVMMLALLVIMVILAINSIFLPGAGEGLKFYLLPSLTRAREVGIFQVIVSAMNQAFFTLSIGIGSMAIFGSYIGRERSLMGESVNIILLDTFVAIVAGLIIFPACTSYNLEVTAGPSLLFDTMATVFNNMGGGRLWGTLFFAFMVFAALSTELAVFENILACVRELTGLNRVKGSIVCGIGIFLISLTTALGYSVLHFQPFAEGSAWLDFWDFIVSTNLLPIGALVFSIFCCSKRFGWGWDNFVAEANAGKGMKVKNWMKPIFQYVVPIAILVIYVIGLTTFSWK